MNVDLMMIQELLCCLKLGAINLMNKKESRLFYTYDHRIYPDKYIRHAEIREIQPTIKKNSLLGLDAI